MRGGDGPLRAAAARRRLPAAGGSASLAAVQAHVAGELAVPPGRLVLHVKTAHFSTTEFELMARLAAASHLTGDSLNSPSTRELV